MQALLEALETDLTGSVIPLAILRLIYLDRALASNDTTWGSFDFALITSFQAFVGVIVASIPFAKPVLDSLILQPYLIGDEELKSITPGYLKGSLWARTIRDSRTSPFHRNPHGFKSLHNRKEGLHQWPSSNYRGDDHQDRGLEIDLGNYTSVSTKRAMMANTDTTGTGSQDERHGSTDQMVIHQTRTATVTTQ